MKWILIPGLGADHRLFSNILDLLPDHQVLTLEMPDENETIEDYARRLLRQAEVDGPFVIAGTSFGGMLSSILCERVKPQALVLMASTDDPAALTGACATFEWMSRALPDTIAQWIRSLSPKYARWFEPASHQDLETFKQMAGDAPVELVRRGGRMIMQWRDVPRITCPRYHLHGDRDVLISHRRLRPTHIIHGAGHLVNLTHPQEVRAFIRHIEEEVTPRQSG